MGFYKEHVIECEHVRVNPEDYVVGILDLGGELMRNDSVERKMYQNASNVAFSRFSKRQRGEHITMGELRRRMSDIRKTGYELGKGYSKLDRSQLWTLLGKVRSDLITKLHS